MAEVFGSGGLALRRSTAEEFAGAERIACNNISAALGQPTPVGAFPHRILGACDIVGNLWEWVLTRSPSSKRGSPSRFLVVGGSFDVKCDDSLTAHAPARLALGGYQSIGFRCVLSKHEIEGPVLAELADALEGENQLVPPDVE